MARNKPNDAAAATAPTADAPAASIQPASEPAPDVVAAPRRRALVLRDCWLGVAGAVIDVAADTAEEIEASGAIDLHPNAIAPEEALTETEDAPIEGDD